MSLEHAPQRHTAATAETHHDVAFWERLITESDAAEFLGLSPRTMQGFRSRGGGPQWLALSARCCRYRRKDLAAWAEARARLNTSEASP